MQHIINFNLQNKFSQKLAYLKPSPEGWLPFFCMENPKTIILVESIGKLDELKFELENFGFLVSENPKFKHKNEAKIFTCNQLFTKTLSQEELESLNLKITKKQNISLEVLTDYLAQIGYARTSMVETETEYSVRGSIVDVFPKGFDLPVRIEIDYDEIVRIATFDVPTQVSQTKLEELEIPAIFVKDVEKELLINQFEKDVLLFFQGEADFNEILEKIEKEFSFKLKELQKLFEPYRILVESLTQKPDFDFGLKPAKTFKGDFEKAVLEFSKFKKVHLYCESKHYKERFLDNFEELNNVIFYEQTLKQGFEIVSLSELVVTNFELLGKKIRVPATKKISPSVALKKLEAMEFGEVVVHVDYGIGIYEGLEKIKMGETEKECLKLAFEGKDYVYVAIEKFNKVQKYVGSNPDEIPKLSKLNSAEWVKTKSKVQKKLELIAAELIKIEAVRKMSQGFAAVPDTDWQNEMENNFEFEETEDQLKVINEIKQDMESDVPMDRLLCGDVGYGKTEVAIRATFKATCSGKQVGILVPTTILAQQHYSTFKERLGNYPVEIRLISRHRTIQEQKDTLSKLKEGKIDILIGTHRLLSKDIEFKDLGLLIIDEEHRFGVKQKEKLKAYQNKVDILTMTATPIPRTLHQSLVGIKNISNINTPPRDRLPVHTEIKTFEPNFIANAIRFELEREGQVFFLHNRVKSIYGISEYLKKLVPEAKIVVGHGQMHGEEVEKIMFDFLEKKYDVLISTTIIESGIDIPNSNTLIINQAQNLGLAQLYQLRGRVGRSDKQGYTYLIVPSLLGISDKARRRLRVIEEHQHLGAGLEIAMKDMELRGAGNILGVEQSGFVKDVGFELYLQMLEEEILTQKAQAENREPEIKIETTINCTAISYIPENFVDTPQTRYEFYKKLSEAKEQTEVLEIAEELKDRFGKFPEQVDNLISLILLKVTAQKGGFDKVNLNEKSLTAYPKEGFWTSEELTNGITAKFVEKGREKNLHFKYLSGEKFGIVYHFGILKWQERFQKAKQLLEIFILER
ncbi:transcription-repair coupling factor [bacterium]|nr:transcription-repair coupling factor [bacterium]